MQKYTAAELYSWLLNREDIAVLDVRNKTDFARFKVESPHPFALHNISYFDFMEIEEECVSQARNFAKNKPIRIICAKEGSAKYVAEILEKHGIDNVGYLEGGIKSWGNLLVPVLLNPEDSFELYQFIRPGKASCSYGLLAGKELQLFDPSRNIQFYLDFAKAKGAEITRCFETHLQADYIAGSRMICAETGAEFLANQADFNTSKITYTELRDGAEYGPAGGPGVTALFTPGHTPGSTSYFIDNCFLISGDTIFIRSVGRPDLGGKVDAWSDALFATLQNIKKMEKSLFVLPGHYMSWDEAQNVGGQRAFVASLAETIEHNKAIYAIDNTTDFLAFIKGNMRPQPEEYATIRLLNSNLETVDDDKAEELDLGKNECAATAYAAQQKTKNKNS